MCFSSWIAHQPTPWKAFIYFSPNGFLYTYWQFLILDLRARWWLSFPFLNSIYDLLQLDQIILRFGCFGLSWSTQMIVCSLSCNSSHAIVRSHPSIFLYLFFRLLIRSLSRHGFGLKENIWKSTMFFALCRKNNSDLVETLMGVLFFVGYFFFLFVCFVFVRCVCLVVVCCCCCECALSIDLSSLY